MLSLEARECICGKISLSQDRRIEKMAEKAKILIIALVLNGFIFAQSSPHDPFDEIFGYTKYSNIQYKNVPGTDPQLLSLDLYVPKIKRKGLFPVMIWVHGGGWKEGDKSNKLTYKITLFISSGWIFASVNYRLSPKKIPSDPKELDPNRIKYPVHEQDVASAIAWVHSHIRKYGGDPNNISLMGHSAGAGIVSLISTDDSFLKYHGLNLSLIKHTVSLDTEAYDVRTCIERGGLISLLYMNAFGTEPEVWEQASPINHVEPGKSIPPFFIVTRGTEDRIALSELFASKLREAGVKTRLIYALPYTHRQVNEAIGNPADLIITPALVKFLGLSYSYMLPRKFR